MIVMDHSFAGATVAIVLHISAPLCYASGQVLLHFPKQQALTEPISLAMQNLLVRESWQSSMYPVESYADLERGMQGHLQGSTVRRQGLQQLCNGQASINVMLSSRVMLSSNSVTVKPATMSC